MKHIFSLVLMLATLLPLAAQDLNKDFEEFKKRQNAEFSQFKKNQQAEYDAFRKRVNDEYAAFMEKTWEEFHGKPAVQPQKQPEIKPTIYEEPEPQAVPQPQVTPQPQPQETPKEEPKIEPAPKPEPKEIPVQPEVVVIPQPTPAPEPIAPVQPKEEEQATKRTSVSFYGTLVSIKFPDPDPFKLTSLDEKDLAAGWKKLSESTYDITLANALAARKSLQLCDWGYLQLLQDVTKKHYGASNEAVFMQAFLMTQSGYKVRLAKDNKSLYLLVASSYDLFGYNYYEIDGKNYYAIDCKAKQLQICPAAVQKEKSMSLQIAKTQKLNEELTDKRRLTSKKGITANLCVNKNEIDFYNNYPNGYINKDVTTSWVAYANTPIDPKVKAQLYPVFEKIIANMSQKEAVNLILNWVQTAFVYEYDDKVWGQDRTFFATETLFYPYCDCEDRSVLFSRMVRDLLHLPVVLLYYPGHLATAVGFSEEVSGDYLIFKNKHYVVCDPTYIGAPVGRTMPDMDNAKAKIVVLKD